VIGPISGHCSRAAGVAALRRPRRHEAACDRFATGGEAPEHVPRQTAALERTGAQYLFKLNGRWTSRTGNAGQMRWRTAFCPCGMIASPLSQSPHEWPVRCRPPRPANILTTAGSSPVRESLSGASCNSSRSPMTTNNQSLWHLNLRICGQFAATPLRRINLLVVATPRLVPGPQNRHIFAMGARERSWDVTGWIAHRDY
jgi:hypothetical protein